MANAPLHGWPLPADREQLLELFLRDRLIEIDAASGVNYAAPVSITAAATLTSTAFYKSHACTGTSADYTVTLPTPTSADLGKLIAFRMDNALTKLVTLDAGSGRTIDGAQTRVMWKNETALLLCVGTSGVCWVKVAGRSLPHSAQMYMSANQSIPNATFPPASMLQIDTVLVDTASLCDTTNKWILIRRAGTYKLTAQAYHSVTGATYILTCYIFSDPGTGTNTLRYTGSETTPTVTGEVSAQTQGQLVCAAGLRLKIAAYQNSGAAKNVLGDPTSQFTFLSVEEVLQW